MYQTIWVSSCVSVQGEFVEMLENGEIVIRDGRTVYRGRPVAREDKAPSQGFLAALASRPEGLHGGAA